MAATEAVTILRLSQSDDLNPRIPVEARAPAVIERFFEAETGRPVSTELRTIWPGPILPDLTEKWLDRYTPEVVVFVVSSFWCTYESIPLMLRDRLGPLGKPVSRVGLKAGGSPLISQRAAFHVMRRWLVRTVGGKPHFTADYVVGVAEACLRRVLAREHIAVVVTGPVTAFGAEMGGAAAARAHARRAELDAKMSALCRQLHVRYVPREAMLGESEQHQFLGDQVHIAEEGHARRGRAEGEAIVDEWRKLHPQTGSG